MEKPSITELSSSEPPSPVDFQPRKGWRKTFSALHNPNYRYFYVGQGISLIGTWARTAALGWLVFQLTRSEFLLGLVATLNALPILVFSTYAGSLADRFPKLWIFKLTSWFALLSSLFIAILLFRGPVGVWVLMIFSALWGTATAFEMPARQSLMVELVGPKDLVNAIALNSAMVNSSRVIGPAVGGFLFLFSPSWCFLLDALSFLAVLYAIYKMRPLTTHSKFAKGNLHYILGGFLYLKTNPLLSQAIALLLVMTLGGWAYLSQLPAFADVRLHLNSFGYGCLMAMTGLGACIAALTMATLGSRLLKAQTLYAGVGIYCLFVILLGMQHNPFVSSVFLFLTGFGLILFFSCGNSLFQTHAPNELRGRLMGIWALVFGGGMPFGSFWMGWVAQKTSSAVSMQAGGIFCFSAAAMIYFIFKGTK